MENLNLNQLEDINGGVVWETYLTVTVATWGIAYGSGYAVGEFIYNVTH